MLGLFPPSCLPTEPEGEGWRPYGRGNGGLKEQNPSLSASCLLAFETV